MIEFTMGLTGAARQLDMVRMMPAEVLYKFARGGTPDAAGMVGTNKVGWQGAQYQRSFLHDLLYAIQQNDIVRARDAWIAVDVTYARQVQSGPRAGGFGSLTTSYAPAADKDDVSDTAFWLSWSLQGILALAASQFWDEFEPKVADLMPKIQRATDYLQRQQDLLVLRDSLTPNRYFITASALLFAGLVLGDGPLIWDASGFCFRGLISQAPEGFFTEASGYDSSYNAVSLWQLQLFNLYCYSQARADAIDAAMEWELSRIDPTGHVMSTGNSRTAGQETYQGSIKSIDYQSVLLALLYFGYRGGNQLVQATADDVYFYWTNPQ